MEGYRISILAHHLLDGKALRLKRAVRSRVNEVVLFQVAIVFSRHHQSRLDLAPPPLSSSLKNRAMKAMMQGKTVQEVASQSNAAISQPQPRCAFSTLPHAGLAVVLTMIQLVVGTEVLTLPPFSETSDRVLLSKRLTHARNLSLLVQTILLATHSAWPSAMTQSSLQM